MGYIRHILRLSISEGEAKRFLRFCVVGCVGAFVNICLFLLLTRIISLFDLISIAISFEGSVISNFLMNDLWTFRDRREGGSKSGLGHIALRGMKFNFVSLGAMGIYYGVYYPLTRHLGVYDIISLVLSILIATGWNFTMNTLWTWK